MNEFKKIVLTSTLSVNLLFGFEIDLFDKNAPLLENFSTNCLQMTQSQQMLKAYVMVGLGSNFNQPKEKLSKAIPIYDKRMYEVRDYFHGLLGSKNEKAKKAFDEAVRLWEESKVMLEATPTQENLVKIKINFLTMINKLLAGTQPLATPDLELISLTGKLCRKPLEVTIDYLIRIWGVEVKNYNKDVEKTITNYHLNLNTLSANKLNNAKSRLLLKKAEKEFRFFEFMYGANGVFVPSLLSKKADQNFGIIRQIKMVFKEEASKNSK